MAKSTVRPSPFAPARLPDVPVVPGVRLAACEAGIRYANRTDLMMAVLDPGTVVAGMLTKSKTCSAPVLWCRSSLGKGVGRALVVNSGNANAFTGKKGADATRMTAEAAAAAVGCAPDEVYVASTGVIGEPLDAAKFAHLLGGLAKSAKPEAWHDAAKAIMTTDTFPKLATRTVRLGNTDVIINGFAKGAGMIAPDLATMLSFIFTDAAVDKRVLQEMLAACADTTFNTITIDSDTSTSDTVLLFATGVAKSRGAPAISSASSPDGRKFAAALHDLMHELALWVVKDGEGLTKLIRIDVDGRRERCRSAPHRLLDRQFAAGEDRGCWRRSQLGPRSDGGWQGWRGRRPRPAIDHLRRHPGGQGRRAGAHLRRAEGRRLHGGPRDRDPGGPGARRGQGHRVDLRPHPRLHLDQRGLPQLVRFWG